MRYQGLPNAIVLTYTYRWDAIFILSLIFIYSLMFDLCILKWNYLIGCWDVLKEILVRFGPLSSSNMGFKGNDMHPV